LFGDHRLMNAVLCHELSLFLLGRRHFHRAAFMVERCSWFTVGVSSIQALSLSLGQFMAERSAATAQIAGEWLASVHCPDRYPQLLFPFFR
jgi:hypothetical protein